MDSLQDRRVHRKGYDPEYWYKRAEVVLHEVGKEEAATWLSHPCTQAFLYQMEANVSSKVLGWIHGMFADADSVDSTAQMQAKALGQAQACDEAIDLINIIGKSQFGETEDNGS